MNDGRHTHHPPGIRLAVGLLLALATGAWAVEFPQGLTLHFGFDDASSTTSVPDKTGRGHGGRGTGLKWTPAGKQAGGMEFAATNSGIIVPRIDAMNPTQLTLAAWFKTAQTAALERCLFDQQAAATGYALAIADSGRLRFIVNGRDCLSDGPVTDGAWHHGSATYDGAQLKLYLDGQLQKQVTALTGAIAANTNDLRIGRRRPGPAPQDKGASFAGVLDEVMIFNGALSAAQVQAVMAAAKPKFSKDDVARRLRELKELLDRGLILPDFYERKVKECEAST